MRKLEYQQGLLDEPAELDESDFLESIARTIFRKGGGLLGELLNPKETGSDQGYIDDQGRLVVTDPLIRESNFRHWFGDSKVVDEEGKPLVFYHGSRADIPAFRNTRNSHLGFHFGTADASNDRLNMTYENDAPQFEQYYEDLREEPWRKKTYQELRDYEEQLRKKTPEVPKDELARRLNEDVNAAMEWFGSYQYQPTAAEQERLQMLQQKEKESRIPVQRFGPKANTLPVNLSVRRPLRLPDVGNWGSVKEIKKVLPWGSNAKTLKEIQAEIQERGYDGIIYKNKVEDYILGNDSYLIFEPTQIKSIHNRGTYNPDDPDMLGYYQRRKGLLDS